MSNNNPLNGIEEEAIAQIIWQLYESGALVRHIMTPERASKLYRVPMPTINSWIRVDPARARVHLPLIEGITNKERMFLTRDFLKCFQTWKPRQAEEIDLPPFLPVGAKQS
jgi:hypothetical protein